MRHTFEGFHAVGCTVNGRHFIHGIQRSKRVKVAPKKLSGVPLKPSLNAEIEIQIRLDKQKVDVIKVAKQSHHHHPYSNTLARRNICLKDTRNEA